MLKRVLLAVATVALCAGLFFANYYSVYRSAVDPDRIRTQNGSLTSAMNYYGMWFNLPVDYLTFTDTLSYDAWVFDLNDGAFERPVEFLNDILKDGKTINSGAYEFAAMYGYSGEAPFQYADCVENPVVVWKFLYDTGYLISMDFQHLQDPRQQEWRYQKFAVGHGSVKLNWRKEMEETDDKE